MEQLVVTPEEARVALKLGREELKCLLESGILPAYKDGRNWKIPVETLKEYPVKRAEEESSRRRKNEGITP